MPLHFPGSDVATFSTLSSLLSSPPAGRATALDAPGSDLYASGGKWAGDPGRFASDTDANYVAYLAAIAAGSVYPAPSVLIGPTPATAVAMSWENGEYSSPYTKWKKDLARGILARSAAAANEPYAGAATVSVHVNVWAGDVEAVGLDYRATALGGIPVSTPHGYSIQTHLSKWFYRSQYFTPTTGATKKCALRNRYSFVCDTSILFLQLCNSASYAYLNKNQIFIDGQLHQTEIALSAVGVVNIVRITFATRERHVIDVYTYADLGEIAIKEADGSVAAYPVTDTILSVDGDSIAYGTGAASFATGCVVTASKNLGFVERSVWCPAQGGTGYVVPGPVNGPAINRLPQFASVNPKGAFLLLHALNDFNDLAANQEAAFLAAVEAYYVALRTACPYGLIIATDGFDGSPTAASNIPRSSLVTKLNELKDSGVIDIVVVLTSNNPILTTANNAVVMAGGPGSGHPGPEGHEIYGYAIASRVRTALTEYIA